jgi:hypothetical protein
VTRRPQPERPVSPGWTVKRATGLGAVAALAAAVLRLFYPASPELVRLPLLASCALAAFCGLSILWITAVDRLRHGRRGVRLRPLRAFDIAMAALLLLPAVLIGPALAAEW